MKIIVSDTGPVLHLHEVNALHILSLAGQVCIPKGVQVELVALIPNWEHSMPGWINVVELSPTFWDKVGAWVQTQLLDRGEAEAIGLALQLNADWFLTDDATARLVAQGLGLEVHGSLGIILWAAAKKHLSRAEAEKILFRLANSSLWISTRILEEAMQALKQLTEE